MPTKPTLPSTDAREFRFAFEELSLVNNDGFAAGLINGSAQITYWVEDGYTEWFIGRIYLDGHRKATERERANGAGLFIRRDVELDYDAATDPECRTFESKLHLAIFAQLDGEKPWRDAISDQVNARIEAERVAA